MAHYIEHAPFASSLLPERTTRSQSLKNTAHAHTCTVQHHATKRHAYMQGINELRYLANVCGVAYPQGTTQQNEVFDRTNHEYQRPLPSLLAGPHIMCTFAVHLPCICHSPMVTMCRHTAKISHRAKEMHGVSPDYVGEGAYQSPPVVDPQRAARTRSCRRLTYPMPTPNNTHTTPNRSLCKQACTRAGRGGRRIA